MATVISRSASVEPARPGAGFATRRQRVLSAGASALAVAGMAGLLWSGLRVDQVAQAARSLIAVDLVPPPPSPTPSPTPPPKPAAKSAPKGDPGERNLKNKATQIVAVKPPVLIVKPPPVAVATTAANTGNASQSGQSDRAGPGQGAGGAGNGLGGGGDGGDGDGIAAVGPKRIRGRLSYGDLPDGLRERMEEVHLETDCIIGADGSVNACRVVRSSGYRAVDALVCDLLEQRYFYRPAVNARGRAISVHWLQNHYFIPNEERR